MTEERFIEKLKKMLCSLLFPSFMKDYQRVKHISECRLNHLKFLMHSGYLYESKKEIFYRKFRESVTLEELKRNSIIDFTYSPEQIADYILHGNVLSGNANIDYNPAEISRKILVERISGSLSGKEMEMLSFLASGFTLKELNVIFGMKHHMSISVKIHRIRKKCMGKSISNEHDLPVDRQ